MRRVASSEKGWVMISMKNKRVIDSWNKIKPDSAADERMLTAILARNKSGKVKNEGVSFMDRALNWKRLVPIAACLVMVVALTVVIGNNTNWLSPSYSVELGGGTLKFHKFSGGLGAASYAYVEGVDCTTRDLTKEENAMLFGDAFGNRDFSAHGVFALGDKWGPDKSLIHVDAGSGSGYWNEGDLNLKIVMAQAQNSIAEMRVFDVGRTVSEVNGVSVSAGYFITEANSQGNKNIIYFASFSLGDTTVYVQVGGAETESETIRNETAAIVEKLTQNIDIDLLRISN